MIEIQDITKVYRLGDVEVRALDGVSFKVEPATGSPSWGRRARASRP